jgi:AraC family transcriptional regulator of arabinose operon
MFENFRDPNLTIAKLADISGYSPAYFSRAFKAYMNDAPIVHLNKLRLSEARALFKNKDLTIGQISEMVGYNNMSTFTEAFKNILGMKPKNIETNTVKLVKYNQRGKSL